MRPDWEFLFTFFIYSLRAIMALFWGVFLLFYGRRSRPNIPLGIGFILIGLVYLRNSFVRFPMLDACDVYNPLSYLVLIFIAPLVIFYAYFSIGEKRSVKHHLAHFIPFVSVFVLWVCLQFSGEGRILFSYSLNELVGHFGTHPLHVSFYLLLIVVFVTQVFVYSFLALVRFIRVGRDYKLHGLSLRPVRLLIVLSLLYMIYTLVCVGFMSYNNALHFGLGFNIFVPVVITIMSVISTQLILPLKTDLSFMDDSSERISPVYTGLIDEDKLEADRKLAAEIKVLFEEKEIFRLPHLVLQDVASELKTNRTYISTYVNNHYGCNFKQFLSRYRIDAAKELLLHTDLDIQEIANRVGFNSRASFYNAFKEYVSAELSPTEWRKQL